MNAQIKKIILAKTNALSEITNQFIDMYNKGNHKTCNLINSFLIQQSSIIAAIKTAASFIKDDNEEDKARDS